MSRVYCNNITIANYQKKTYSKITYLGVVSILVCRITRSRIVTKAKIVKTNNCFFKYYNLS